VPLPLPLPESGDDPPELSAEVEVVVEAVLGVVEVVTGVTAEPWLPPGTVRRGVLVVFEALSLPPHEATPIATRMPPVAATATTVAW
jgi:hypothetical protein